eukprot:6293004-Pyramimonas_sp.AAC.1
MQKAPRERARGADHGRPPACSRRALCIAWTGKVAVFAERPSESERGGVAAVTRLRARVAHPLSFGMERLPR